MAILWANLAGRTRHYLFDLLEGKMKDLAGSSHGKLDG